MMPLWSKRNIILIICILAFSVIPIIVGVLAVTERGVRDPYNRTVGPGKVWKVLRKTVLRKSDISQMAVCFCSSDREIRLTREDGLSTAASIYNRGRSGSQTGIILIHGNTSMGRKLAMYKVLASKLADYGYAVLTLDLPGFGESDDPYVLGTIEALEGVSMLRAAVHYMIHEEKIASGNFSLVGHSGGADVAFKAGLSANEIKTIIAIGPPRRRNERLEDPKDTEYFRKRAQDTHLFVYGTQFPSWYTADVWRKHVEQGDMEDYIEYFSQEGHTPLMLVDGELEGQEDKLYLERFASDVTDPKKFVRLKRSDHYGNTAQSLGLIFYDKGVMDQLVHEIVQWLGHWHPLAEMTDGTGERQPAETGAS